MLIFVLSQAQTNQEHSHSTQASPTNTLNHSKRPRARSADESNKNLLSPRDAKQSDENWVSDVRGTTARDELTQNHFFFAEYSSRRDFDWPANWFWFVWNGV